MGKIYSLPKEIGEPPRFITSDNYDSFLKAEQEYVEKLISWGDIKETFPPNQNVRWIVNRVTLRWLHG